jgi:hypothetical protein
VDIFQPLWYTAIRTKRGTLVNLIWVMCCIHLSAQVFLALKFPLCGPNVVDHFPCEAEAWLNPLTWTLMLWTHGQCLIVGSYSCWISKSFLGPTFSFYITWVITVQEDGNPSLFVPSITLLTFYFLFYLCIVTNIRLPTHFQRKDSSHALHLWDPFYSSL